jgi:hypothetical protein
MSAAPASAEQPKPSRTGRLLDLVRRLIDYGRELAASLHQHTATDPCSVGHSFGTADLALILLRIRRGLLRANALEARLVQNAARLDAGPRPRSASTPHESCSARAPASRIEDPDAPIDLPTEAEIAAWVRRRPIGAVIADICRDLGITANHPLWRELHHAITAQGGNYTTMVMDMIHRGGRFITEARHADAPAAPAGTGPP